MEEVSIKKKSLLIGVGIAVVIILIIFISVSSSSAAKVTDKEKEITALQKEIKTQETSLKEANGEIKDLKEKVAFAKPWFDLDKKEQEEKVKEIAAKEAAEKAKVEKVAADKAAKEKAEKAAAEKIAAAKEAEAKKKAEEEAKRGYETGITYNQLARTPDDFELEKVKFKGKVIQVLETEGETQIRLAVNDDYDQIIYGAYDSSIVDSRVLDDDWITIMGTSNGLLSYESTNGGNITIPSVIIDKIQQ